MKKLESYLKKAEKDPKYDITLLSKLELKWKSFIAYFKSIINIIIMNNKINIKDLH